MRASVNVNFGEYDVGVCLCMCVHACVRLCVNLCECDCDFLTCASFCVAPSVPNVTRHVLCFLLSYMLHEDVSSRAQVTPTKNAVLCGASAKNAALSLWCGSANAVLSLWCGSANAALSLWCGSANAALSLWCGSANAAVSLAGRSRGHLANAALHKRSLCCRIS